LDESIPKHYYPLSGINIMTIFNLETASKFRSTTNMHTYPLSELQYGESGSDSEYENQEIISIIGLIRHFPDAQGICTPKIAEA